MNAQPKIIAASAAPAWVTTMLANLAAHNAGKAVRHKPDSQKTEAAQRQLALFHEGWTQFHRGAMAVKTAADAAAYAAWLQTGLQRYFGACETCVSGWTAILTANPLPTDPTLVWAWSVNLHNAVNAKSGHPAMTTAAALARWTSQLVTSLTKDEVASLDQLIEQAGQAKTEDDRVGLLSSTLAARGQIVCGGCRSAWVGYMRRNPFPVAVQDVQGWLVRLRVVLVKSESDFASKAIDPQTRSGM